jgi:hypothetical protein
VANLVYLLGVPAIAAWLLTGLALVVVLPIGSAPRSGLRGWPGRYKCGLLGPLVWYAYRRQLLVTANVTYHPSYDLSNPIAAFGVWTASMVLACASVWWDYASAVAHMVEQGEYWGDNVQIFAGYFVLRLAPPILLWVVLGAVMVIDLALILMRIVRRRSRGTGSGADSDQPEGT